MYLTFFGYHRFASVTQLINAINIHINVVAVTVHGWSNQVVLSDEPVDTFHHRARTCAADCSDVGPRCSRVIETHWPAHACRRADQTLAQAWISVGLSFLVQFASCLVFTSTEGRTVGRSVSQFVGRLVGWSVCRSVCRSVNRSFSLLVSRSVSLSVSQSVI